VVGFYANFVSKCVHAISAKDAALPDNTFYPSSAIESITGNNGTSTLRGTAVVTSNSLTWV